MNHLHPTIQFLFLILDMSFVPPTRPHPTAADFDFYFDDLHPSLTDLLLMNSNRLGSYTHIRYVCEKCAVDVNLVQKQVNGWDTSEMKELCYYNV